MLENIMYNSKSNESVRLSYLTLIQKNSALFIKLKYHGSK